MRQSWISLPSFRFPQHKNLMLLFDPFESFVDTNFWISLTENKLNFLKLSVDKVGITAEYSRGRKATKLLPTRLMLKSMEPDSSKTPGILINTNTLNDFKDLDKSAFLQEIGKEIYDGIESLSILENPSLLAKFGLLTFCDLKKYKYYYWFCFPTIVPKSPVVADSIGSLADHKNGADLFNLNPPAELKFFLIVKTASKTFAIKPLKEYKSYDMSTTLFGYIDPSCQPKNPSSILRNYLALISKLSPSPQIQIISFRETLQDSLFITISPPPFDAVTFVGWEKGISGISPRVVDLAPMMDPKSLADSAVDLNLKLMRWRILPDLDLPSIQNSKCLLLGAGTLGCFVGRLLLAWGVRGITLVDNGRVSFSNPVRQPLFTFEDCLGGGKPKAEAAAEGLRRVFPGVNAVGVDLSIPMPGHFVDSEKVVTERIEKLKELIDDHDVVFLLTDSRESRWLPTVLAAVAKKVIFYLILDCYKYCTRFRYLSCHEAWHERLGESYERKTRMLLL